MPGSFKPDIFVSYLVFKTNPLVSTAFTFATYLSHNFLTASLSTTSVSLLNSLETDLNSLTSILSISAYRLAKSDFAPNLDVSTLLAFFKSVFVA